MTDLRGEHAVNADKASAAVDTTASVVDKYSDATWEEMRDRHRRERDALAARQDRQRRRLGRAQVVGSLIGALTSALITVLVMATIGISVVVNAYGVSDSVLIPIVAGGLGAIIGQIVGICWHERISRREDAMPL